MLASRIIFRFIFCFIPLSLHASTEKATAEFKKTNVFFEVQKNLNSFTLIGREKGLSEESPREVFRYQTASDKATTPSDNFFVKKDGSRWTWVYGSGEKGEFLELSIDSEGNVSLDQSIRKYTGFKDAKTYGFKTPGIFENRGSQAFYSLVVDAQQIHNYGTIQTGRMHFFQDYLFNAGVIRLGVKKEELETVDLLESIVIATPHYYTSKTVENYGIFLEPGTLAIEDGLNYIEHKVSNFCNLKMSGGAIHLKKAACMKVTNTLTGTIREIILEEKATFFGAGLSFNAEKENVLENFYIKQSAGFYASNSLDLKTKHFSNHGALYSGGNLTLKIMEDENEGMFKVSAQACQIFESEKQVGGSKVENTFYSDNMEYLKTNIQKSDCPTKAPNVLNKIKEERESLVRIVQGMYQLFDQPLLTFYQTLHSKSDPRFKKFEKDSNLRFPESSLSLFKKDFEKLRICLPCSTTNNKFF